MKKYLLLFLLLASCKEQKTYIFKPGDTVKVHSTRFLILDYNKSRKGLFYNARDLKHGFFVEYFSQERVKRKMISPVKTVSAEPNFVQKKSFKEKTRLH